MRVNWVSRLPPLAGDAPAFAEHLLPAMASRGPLKIWSVAAAWDAGLAAYGAVTYLDPDRLRWADVNESDATVYVLDDATESAAIWRMARRHRGVVVLASGGLGRLIAGIPEAADDDREEVRRYLRRVRGAAAADDARRLWGEAPDGPPEVAGRVRFADLLAESALGVVSLALDAGPAAIAGDVPSFVAAPGETGPDAFADRLRALLAQAIGGRPAAAARVLGQRVSEEIGSWGARARRAVPSAAASHVEAAVRELRTLVPGRTFPVRIEPPARERGAPASETLAPSHPLDPEELRAQVSRLGPWFHQIELGHGIRTKVASAAGEPLDHPRAMWEIVRGCLPERLEGLAVLDVGCNGGFYAVEACRRGADRVVAVDAQRRMVRQARLVARALQFPVDVRRCSVYELDPFQLGLYDLTLALGLLYHCKNPYLALERLAGVTRGMLVVETAFLTGSPAEPRADAVGASRMLIHPTAWLARPSTTGAKESVDNWFLPSLPALRAMLHEAGFQEVAVHAVVGERAVVVASNRRVADSQLPEGLRAAITVREAPTACAPGAPIVLDVHVENRGTSRWLSQGEPRDGLGRVSLGAHLMTLSGDEWSFDAGRAVLPRDLGPGEAVDLALQIVAPTVAGSYEVELDLVSEHVTWLEDVGSPLARHRIDVG